MKKLYIFGTLAVLVSTLVVSFNHTLALFRTGGYTEGLEWWATIGAETAFLMGVVKIVNSRRNGTSPGWAAIMLFMLGLSVVGWSNVLAGLDRGLTGILLGVLIPLFLFGAESVLSDEFIKSAKQKDKSGHDVNDQDKSGYDNIRMNKSGHNAVHPDLSRSRYDMDNPDKSGQNIIQLDKSVHNVIQTDKSGSGHNHIQLDKSGQDTNQLDNSKQDNSHMDKSGYDNIQESKSGQDIIEKSGHDAIQENKTGQDNIQENESGHDVIQENKSGQDTIQADKSGQDEKSGHDTEHKSGSGQNIIQLDKSRQNTEEEIQRVIEFARRIEKETGKRPGRDRLKKLANCTEYVAKKALEELKKTG